MTLQNKIKLFSNVIVIIVFSGISYGSTVGGVDTYADLRALSIPPANKMVEVAYRAYTDDKGGGLFVWESNSTKTVDDAIVILPTGHVGNGRWERRFEEYISPSWFGVQGTGATDDADFLQAALDRPEPVRFDKNCYVAKTVDVSGDGKSVDFNGYSIIAIPSVSTQDAVLTITGRNLRLYDVKVEGQLLARDEFETAIRWYSRNIQNAAQHNRVFGLEIRNSLGGLLFGNKLTLSPDDYPQSENYIWGMKCYGVQDCLRINITNGILFIDGSTLDCAPYAWAGNGNFSDANARAFDVKAGELIITNSELIKTTSALGCLFRGPAYLTNCQMEHPGSFGYLTGPINLVNCSGYMGQTDYALFMVEDNSVGECRLTGCDFLRADGGLDRNSFIAYGLAASNYKFWISDTVFDGWRRSKFSYGNSVLSAQNVYFPQDTAGPNNKYDLRLESGCLIQSGSGVPTSVTAPTGSLWLRSDGGASTTLYVKEPTGWVAK